MKHFVLVDESNNFDSFLKDNTIKKYINTKISWMKHLMIILRDDTPEDTISYILLKYGDNIKNTKDLTVDRSPIMYAEYDPKANNKFTKYIYENQRTSKRG